MKYFDDRFIASSGFSWIDLYLYIVLDWITEKESLLDKFKNVKACFDKLVAIPGIAHWLKVRPVTEM